MSAHSDKASQLKMDILKGMFEERKQSALALQFKRECNILFKDGLFTQELAVAYIIELGEIQPDPPRSNRGR